jgi:uncharacterized protein (TIGR02246 family)
MKADARTEGEVRAAVQRLTEAYAKRDLQALLGCFAADDDVLLYGTGPDEKRVGLREIRAQVERDWAQADATAISLGWTSISAAGPTAWVAADGAFVFKVNGQSETVPARASLVLEKRDGKWLIVHSHFSRPSMDQEEGQSY